MRVDISNMAALMVRISWTKIILRHLRNLKTGNLALSRAIGDFTFKKNTALSPEEQIITANPDIMEHEITEDDEFLILACDGRLYTKSFYIYSIDPE